MRQGTIDHQEIREKGEGEKGGEKGRGHKERQSGKEHNKKHEQRRECGRN